MSLSILQLVQLIDSTGLDKSVETARRAGHVQQFGSESLLPDLMEVRVSEAQGRRREAGSEGSV